MIQSSHTKLWTPFDVVIVTVKQVLVRAIGLAPTDRLLYNTVEAEDDYDDIDVCHIDKKCALMRDNYLKI